MGKEGGSLAWIVFSGALLPVEDFITSRRPIIYLRFIPIASKTKESPCIWLTSTKGR